VEASLLPLAEVDPPLLPGGDARHRSVERARDTVLPGEVVAAAGRDQAEALALEVEPLDHLVQGAVAADGNDQIAGCLARQLGRMAGATCLDDLHLQAVTGAGAAERVGVRAAAGAAGPGVEDQQRPRGHPVTGCRRPAVQGTTSITIFLPTPPINPLNIACQQPNGTSGSLRIRL